MLNGQRSVPLFNRCFHRKCGDEVQCRTCVKIQPAVPVAEVISLDDLLISGAEFTADVALVEKNESHANCRRVAGFSKKKTRRPGTVLPKIVRCYVIDGTTMWWVIFAEI